MARWVWFERVTDWHDGMVAPACVDAEAVVLLESGKTTGGQVVVSVSTGGGICLLVLGEDMKAVAEELGIPYYGWAKIGR